MSQIDSTCKWQNQYASCLNGEMNPGMQAEFQAHIEQCKLCRDGLEQAAAGETYWHEAGDLLHSYVDFTFDDLDAEPGIPRQTEQIVRSLAPTDDPEKLGRLGPYEISGVIGQGGMGIVLKAVDPSLDRVVAIKVLAPHLATCDSARQRFARESKAAAAVLHPNVIAIHGVSNNQSLPYLVMPYVRGQSLQRRIDTDGQLPLKEIVRIGAQIAAGLAAAHQQGLVHRDIKPGNILLEDGVERLLITDFGLARAVDDGSMTRSGVLAGTPQYMSPEQIRGESIDSRSDLFALGSVLYATSTGCSPFRAETSFAILHRIATENPQPIRQLNPEIPNWLCRLIEQLHQKDPANRLQTASKVEELLWQCLAHLQQPTTNLLPKQLAANSAWRSWRSATVFAATLLAFIVGYFVMNPPLTRTSPPSDTVNQVVPPSGEISQLTSGDETMQLDWEDPFASDLLKHAIELEQQSESPFPQDTFDALEN